MAALLDHLDQVSIFGRSAVALLVILAVDWAFSAFHSYEEWRGAKTSPYPQQRGAKAPLWRIFGAVVGVWLPHWLGFLSFTIGLTLLLWSAGLVGIAGWFPNGHLTEPVTVVAVGAIIGARISDTLISHWGLYAVGYRPNPGLPSTPLYLLEAAFIGLTFWKGLSLHPVAAWVGFACGAGFFIAVLPVLRTVGAIAPGWRRPAWVRWQPLPEWATK